MIKKIPNAFQVFHFTIVVLGLAYAYLNQFIQDDAYISFRYAENYANGLGMIFNIGDKVEGYTNFLWTYLLGTSISIGLQPEIMCLAFGMLSLIIVYLLFYQLSSKVLNKKKLTVWASASLFLNYSFSSYVTGGLETQAQLLLMILTFYLTTTLEKSKVNYILLTIISLLFGAMILNRLDSGIYIGLMGLYILHLILTNKENNKVKIVSILALIVPVLTILLLWFNWKLQFYGDILPNTFYTKIGAKPAIYISAMKGIAFIAFFSVAYFLLPSIFAIINYKTIKASFNFSSFKINSYFTMAIIIVLYNIYFVYVGGDFMEFRFQIPFLPFYILGFFWITRNCRSSYLLPILFLLNSILYSQSFKGAFFGFESVNYLKYHIEGEASDWKGIGEKLNTYFKDSNVKIAISPAGAIPYFSNLYSIDMLGLNDKWIAKHGLKYKNSPGHYKIAPLEYLQKQKVNLIIGHPMMIKNDELPNVTSQIDSGIFQKLLPCLDKNKLSNTSHSIIGVPINDKFTLLCWYLNYNQTIDKNIRTGIISQYKVTL